jgi:hypothetical protein
MQKQNGWKLQPFLYIIVYKKYFLNENKVWPTLFVQLNKCETHLYFLQNFQCTTILIYSFCKSCEYGCELKIVFVYFLESIFVLIFFNNFRFAKYLDNQTNCHIALENLKNIYLDLSHIHLAIKSGFCFKLK